MYTILIPAYKEPEVLPILINAIKKMDYPQNKLDVILLLEEDDEFTLKAAKAEKPPGNWRFIIVPNSLKIITILFGVASTVAGFLNILGSTRKID